MEATGSSETLQSIYWTTRGHIWRRGGTKFLQSVGVGST